MARTRNANADASQGTLPFTASKVNAKRSNSKQQKAKAKAIAISAEKQDVINSHMWASEFAKTERSLPRSALGDLSNDPLPLFAPANFPDVNNYEVIKPSVRLASQLLRHPSLRPMLRTITKHRKFVKLNEVDENGNELYRYPANSKPVTRNDIDSINSSLDGLANVVNFKARDQLDRANAKTVPLNQRVTKNRTLRGVRSTIEYSSALLATLTEANKAPAEERDIPLTLAWQFTFAVQLAHETCHALVFAKDGDLDTEPFFPNADIAEVGWELEKTLFGGFPCILWEIGQPDVEGTMQVHKKRPKELSDLVGMPVVWSSPCTWTVREYKAQDLGMWVRESKGEALEPPDVAWRVSMADLKKFFEAKFWREENPSTTLEHKVGFAFTCDEDGVKELSDIKKSELKRFCTPLQEYRISKHRAIVRR